MIAGVAPSPYINSEFLQPAAQFFYCAQRLRQLGRPGADASLYCVPGPELLICVPDPAEKSNAGALILIVAASTGPNGCANRAEKREYGARPALEIAHRIRPTCKIAQKGKLTEMLGWPARVARTCNARSQVARRATAGRYGNSHSAPAALFWPS